MFDVELLAIFEGSVRSDGRKRDTERREKDPVRFLAYKVIENGSGTRKPQATDQVQVNYTGWTTDGKMFDSSITRGKPATFPLNGVIKGWTEGVQLMTEGEKARFWIPANLAYGDNAGGGRPAGMLVFDIELQKIL